MPASTMPFAFLGERLCLDFANTVDWHASESPGERLKTVADLLKWGRDAQLLDDESHQRLTRQATSHPQQANAVLSRARELREVIYRVFSAISHQQPPAPSDLQALTEARLEAAQHQRLTGNGAASFDWEWQTGNDLNRLWWPIAIDAAALLTSDMLHRVGECPDDRGCGWLFLDTSKAGKRRWCSMKDCGNRAKARRHRGIQNMER